MISKTDVTVTTTGTIGLEAAIIGKKAVIVNNYYATNLDFIVVKDLNVRGLAEQVKNFPEPENLRERQRRIVETCCKDLSMVSFMHLKRTQQVRSVVKLATSHLL